MATGGLTDELDFDKSGGKNTIAEGKVEGDHGKIDGNKCVTWISRELQEEDEKLIISECSDQFQKLRISNSEFLNFVTIFGPARAGKSSLANYLVGKHVFDTASTVEVCTKDVKMFLMEDFTVGNNGGACFIDTEGQGDEDEESDVTLLTPVIILSKVIIFNWKGGLQKYEILKKIAILVEVGNCVSSKTFEDGDKKFGHLFIALRDQLEGTAADAHKLIFAPEKGRTNKAKAINQIREKLLASFESIETVMLAPPCSSFEETKEISFDMTSEVFKEEVQQLKAKIMVKLSEPRKFGKNTLSPKNAQHFVNIFVEQIQVGDLVNISNAVAQMQRDIIDKAAEHFDQRFNDSLDHASIPMADGSAEKLENDRKEYLEDFKKETDDVDLETAYGEKKLQMLDDQSATRLQIKKTQDSLEKRLMKCKKLGWAKSIAEWGKNVAPFLNIAKTVLTLVKPMAQDATGSNSSDSPTDPSASSVFDPESLLFSLASDLVLRCARNPEMIEAMLNRISSHFEAD